MQGLTVCCDLLQVVLAVDDSRSMAETGCGVFALEAVSLLAKSLARLEVGDVGLVSFGGGRGVVPLHPLTRPFTDADGPGIMSALRFDQVSHPLACHHFVASVHDGCLLLS